MSASPISLELAPFLYTLRRKISHSACPVIERQGDRNSCLVKREKIQQVVAALGRGKITRTSIPRACLPGP